MDTKKILIIDDDEDFIESTKVVLEAADYIVNSATTTEEGFAQIEASRPDLIILDVIMKKTCDGFDLSRKIKNNKKYKLIPIFMITAIGDKTGFKYSAESSDDVWLPVEDYAEKPINAAELLKRVKNLI